MAASPGEEQFSGPAGTVVVFHHGLWHAGQPNPSGTDRWMHKVRLNPTAPQVRLWNTADLDEFQNPPSDHAMAERLVKALDRYVQGHAAESTMGSSP